MAEDTDLMWKALLRHYRPTKPIIAAVEGVAIAGGTEILQGTDIRVAGESAKFGVSEARWSLYPMGGSAVVETAPPCTGASCSLWPTLLTGPCGSMSSARVTTSAGALRRLALAEPSLRRSSRCGPS